MDIVGRAGRARAWLIGQAWPLWAESGLDGEHGAFHEHLRHDDLACGADHRRLRVLTRQIYVFSKAAEHGFDRGRDVVRTGLGRLLGDARQEDGLYAVRFDLHHRPVDQTRDLYDHAFVLLALASAAGLEDPPVPRATLHGAACALLERLLTRFRHPAGGFVESLPPALPRRQNPHMHLLEAALAAHAVFGDAAFAALAAELGVLFLDRLLLRHAPHAAVLPEYFDDALRPQEPVLVEPGHHYEWVWLLDGLARLDGAAPRRADLRDAADLLNHFADAYGLCPSRGVVVDQLDARGRVVSADARLWPQTERLKAALVRAVARPGPETLAAVDAADDVLAAYLGAGRPGLWAEHLDAAGRFSSGPAPASSLYHITCALVELIRLAPVLSAGAGGMPGGHGQPGSVR